MNPAAQLQPLQVGRGKRSSRVGREQMLKRANSIKASRICTSKQSECRKSIEIYVLDRYGGGRPQGLEDRKKLHVRRSCGFSDWMPSKALKVLERGYEGSLCVQRPVKKAWSGRGG